MADRKGFTVSEAASYQWPEPDMGVLRMHRRTAPALPLSMFGPLWAAWIAETAQAASAPPDYVAAALLSAASSLIGNARWAECGPGWREPPHLWLAVVGESGSSKTPAAATLLRDVLPELERRMGEDFPEKLRLWKAEAEAHRAATEQWRKDVEAARKMGNPPPLPPRDMAPQPEAPRLVQGDVTIERMGTLLANTAPKGLLVVRDELVGFLLGMTTYNESGRAFWLEAWNGGPFRVERVKHPEPVMIARHAVALFGGIQPERLADLMESPDDGLLARFAWCWPDPVPFDLAAAAPATGFAIRALDRLRCLTLLEPEGEPGAAHPRYVAMTVSGRALMRDFGRDMQERQKDAGGLMRSAYGKARGLVLRLSLVLEYLDWCADTSGRPEPDCISDAAFARAATLVADYLMPMAERVYGDAAATQRDRNVATLARHIHKKKPEGLSVRELCRAPLPGLREAEPIHDAADKLIEAGWLAPMHRGDGKGRPATVYPVNPALRNAA